MSLIQQQAQAVSIQYIAFPNQYGLADCVYINDRGLIRKKPLSTVFLNSISFYTLMNPFSVGTAVTISNFIYLYPTSTPTEITTAVYLATPFGNSDSSGNNVLQVGSLCWNFTNACFFGYLLVLLNIACENSPPINTFVNCLVSGSLSSSAATATVVSQNPIILNTAMQVYDPKAPAVNGFPGTYSDQGVQNAIRSRLRGNVQISFPSGPLYSWINGSSTIPAYPNDQYFSASYSPF
jgi:hypothetical protein